MASSDKSVAALFLSVSYRLKRHEDVLETGGGIFAEKLHYTEDPSLMALAQIPRLADGTPPPQSIYAREVTRSYVSLLQSPDGSQRLVCKLFGIPSTAASHQQRGDDLLESYEVEARYLKVLSFLMAHRLTEACTLLLGTAVLTREQAETSGLLGRELFPASSKRRAGKERYALMIAEAADHSLAQHVFDGSRLLDYSRPLFAYSVRVVLFQMVHALAAIHRIFPSFQHLDLHCSNWLVQRVDAGALRRSLRLPPEQPLLVEYGYGNQRWQVDLERAPFRLMMWDMYYSYIAPAETNAYGLPRMQPRERMYGPGSGMPRTQPNQFVDIWKSADTLRWVLSRCGHGNLAYEELPADVRGFFEDVAPPHLSVAGLDKESEADKVLKRERQERVHGAFLPLSSTELLQEHPVFRELEVDPLSRSRARPLYRIDASRTVGELRGGMPLDFFFQSPDAHSTPPPNP